MTPRLPQRCPHCPKGFLMWEPVGKGLLGTCINCGREYWPREAQQAQTIAALPAWLKERT